MTLPDRVAAARDQLTRILGFFPRVDAKASVVLAVDTSMLALLVTRAFPYMNLRWELVPIALAVAALSFSLWNIYKEGFPSLDGGEESLLYFREVAKKTEAKYLEAWNGFTDEQYLADLLGQAWRNSVILTKKFDRIRMALIWLAVAIPFWIAALALLSLTQHPQ